MPVRAWPIMSVPSSAKGSVSSWIANVRVIPSSASASQISAATPNSTNVGDWDSATATPLLFVTSRDTTA